VFPR